MSADAEVTAHLSLAPSANEKLSGMANFSDPKASPSIVIDYRWPFQNGISTLLSDLPSPAEAARFSYRIPPLSGLGGQFCMSVFAGRSGTRLCGMPTGTPPIIFEMPTSPSLLTPRDLAQAEAATEFSWTAFTGGIHRLRFEPVSNPDIPVVDVYTSRTTATWLDLKGLGIPFPAGRVAALLARIKKMLFTVNRVNVQKYWSRENPRILPRELQVESSSRRGQFCGSGMVPLCRIGLLPVVPARAPSFIDHAYG